MKHGLKPPSAWPPQHPTCSIQPGDFTPGEWSVAIPFLPAPVWAVTTKPVYTSAALPVEVRESLANLSQWLASIGSSDEKTNTLYEVPSLLALGVPRLGSGGAAQLTGDPQLLIVSAAFHAHPFQDPMTGKNYVRARWFDTQNGVWLTPDPKGYVDSSNLYAFAGGDPVNGRDPMGTQTGSQAGTPSGTSTSDCEFVLVVNRVPYRPYLEDCTGKVVVLPEEKPPIDCSRGCIGPAPPPRPSTATIGAPRAAPGLPATQYGSYSDRALGLLMAMGDAVNGMTNALEWEINRRPPVIFEPQSQTQAAVKRNFELVTGVTGTYSVLRGGFQTINRRSPTRVPVKEPLVEADFEYNGKIYSDANPTARAPGFRTGERIEGLSAANRDTTHAHAEIGGMHQPYAAGLRGGSATLRVSGQTICPFCKGDIKKFARMLRLERLKVVDFETGRVYEFVGDELLPVKQGGKGWKQK